MNSFLQPLDFWDCRSLNLKAWIIYGTTGLFTQKNFKTKSFWGQSVLGLKYLWKRRVLGSDIASLVKPPLVFGSNFSRLSFRAKEPEDFSSNMWIQLPTWAWCSGQAGAHQVLYKCQLTLMPCPAPPCDRIDWGQGCWVSRRWSLNRTSQHNW